MWSNLLRIDRQPVTLGVCDTQISTLLYTHNIFMHSILKHYKCVAKARKGMLSKSFSRFKNGTFLITIALVLILTGLSGLWTDKTILSN